MMSLGLCFLNEKQEIFIIQKSQDDMLWQMPEIPIEKESNIEKTITNSVNLFFPQSNFTLLKERKDLIEQQIPEYIAKKEGLTRAISEYQKWFIIQVENTDASSPLDNSLYSHTQWALVDNIITLIAPHKRLTYKLILDDVKTMFSLKKNDNISQAFKDGSLVISKKTRQMVTN